MGTRILIADDHELVREGLRSVLARHAGWEVCAEAESGDEAVAMAAVLKPDLIILDLLMPRMDGLEAARHIRKIAPGLPIILHTLYLSPEVESAAHQIGIRKVAWKNNSTALIAQIEELFAGTPLQCSQPAGHAQPLP
jgi:DNA-binding NarL/FixJ family response regulator